MMAHLHQARQLHHYAQLVHLPRRPPDGVPPIPSPTNQRRVCFSQEMESQLNVPRILVIPFLT
jgi:hypothetical protein